jgi:energy-coupling factor transporter ATP-binding protein EcfA2
VKNFRCIDDTTPFSIGQVTCLVGKNESGKTAILQALERLNPSDQNRQSYDKLRDYPRRHFSDYAARHPDGEAEVLLTQWELEPEDHRVLVDEFGPACVTGTAVQIAKSYEQSGNTWNTPIDEKQILHYLMSQAGLGAEHIEAFAQFHSSADFHTHMRSLGERTEAMTALMERIGRFRQRSIELHAVDLLSTRLPKFLYFSQYGRMSGDVAIEQLRRDISANSVSEGDQVFREFLAFAGTNLEDLQNATQYEELNARCEAASNKITDQIFEYWTQNQHLALEVEIQAGKSGDPPPFTSGTVMHARVRNNLHRITVPFSDRSAGFIWFFSFLIMFSQVRKKQGNVIILLDEPGLNLHGTAQRDLLRYIKEQLSDHQVLYTTHSPFMIPADDLASVRTVEDVVRMPRPMVFEVLGTKVGDTVLSTDPETLFPLQGALGYEITQSLFVGEHTLLVEGPSGILYLQAASAALKERGQTSLDSRWVLCPASGLEKVHAFVSLLGGKKLHIAVLAGIAQGQKGKGEQLKKSALLQAGHVYTIADFCDQEEADIEDLFTPDLFSALMNSAYKLPTQHRLTIERLEAADPSTPRKVKKAEAYWELLPSEVPPFSHYTPAYWLFQNPKFLSEKSKAVNETLERFAKIFTTLNNLL